MLLARWMTVIQCRNYLQDEFYYYYPELSTTGLVRHAEMREPEPMGERSMHDAQEKRDG